MSCSARPKAVHYGAGNIGRGFLGQLYAQSGYTTVFVDVDAELVRLLNDRNEYPLRIAGKKKGTIRVADVCSVDGRSPEATDVLINADIASTAVGVHALDPVAGSIAGALEKRFESGNETPLDIIVCENLLDAGGYLKNKVREHIAAEHAGALDSRIGFVNASIGRMVPIMTPEMRKGDPLLVVVEEYCRLPVDQAAFRGPIPPIEGLEPRENFVAYVERKLFVHNTGHAVAAYLGYLRGHTYIHEAVADGEILAFVEAAMAESKLALIRKHSMDETELNDHIADLVRRFGNAALEDTVARVANDPVRKLGPQDRLVGAANNAVSQNVTPQAISLGVAAALCYDEPTDPEAVKVRDVVDADGIEKALETFCELTADDVLTQLVLDGLQRLENNGWIDPNTKRRRTS